MITKYDIIMLGNSQFVYFVPHMKRIVVNLIFCLSAVIHSNSCNEADRPQLSLLSPSKINLFLKVYGKNPDGFHELSSLFSATDFGDDMTFLMLCGSHTEDILEMFSADYTELPPNNKHNLIIKALELFRKESNFANPPYFRVTIRKRIPMEAGLGGGSSNAATTLYAVNRLTGNIFDESALSKLGAKLGSDVPFFFSSGLALIQGRGEKVIDIVESLPFQDAPIFVYKPQFGQATAPVFKNFNSQIDTTSYPTTSSLMFSVFDTKSRPSLFWTKNYFDGITTNPWAVNDLTSPAVRVNPLQGRAVKLMKWLFPYGGAWMSGSGSSVIGLGEPRDEMSGEEVAWTLENEMEGGRLWGSRFIRRDANGWYEKRMMERV